MMWREMSETTLHHLQHYPVPYLAEGAKRELERRRQIHNAKRRKRYQERKQTR